MVECAVHLQFHPFFESVVYDRGDARHFIGIVALFLYDRCDDQSLSHSGPAEVTAEIFLCKRIKFFVGFIKYIPDDPFFIGCAGQQISSGNDISLFEAGEFCVISIQFCFIQHQISG